MIMKEEKKLNVRFCGYCGKQTRTWPKPADECFMFYGDQSSITIAPKYNKETGRKNYVQMFECHDYRKKKWYQFIRSPHDSYFLEEVFNF